MDKKLLSMGLGTFAGAFAAVLCLSAVNGCGRKSDVVAIVNGEAITASDFSMYLQNKPSVDVISDNGVTSFPVNGSLGFQAMRDLIEQQLELQVAKEKGIFPTEADVDGELLIKKNADPNYMIELIEKGLTLAAIKREIRLEIVADRLLTQGVRVTKEDAENYIRNNPEKFVDPPHVELSYILVKDPASEAKIDQELAGGQSFSTVAIRFSEAPTARSFSGKYTDPAAGPTALSSLPTSVQKAVSALNGEGTTGWIPASGGFARFCVEKAYPAKPMAIDDAKVEQVRRDLAKAEGAKSNDLSRIIRKKLMRSQVEIVPEEYRNQWKSDQE